MIENKINMDIEISGKSQFKIDRKIKIGNSIAGFTENEHADKLIAYAIYTNWNWEDPIR